MEKLGDRVLQFMARVREASLRGLPVGVAPKCEHCNDSGWFQMKNGRYTVCPHRTVEFEDAATAQRHFNAKIPEAFQAVSFKTKDKRVIAYMHSGGSAMIFTPGPERRGTALAVTMLRASIDSGITGLFLSAHEFFMDAREAILSKDEDGNSKERKYWDDLDNNTVIVVDGVFSVAHTAFEIDALCKLLDRRGLHKKDLILVFAPGWSLNRIEQKTKDNKLNPSLYANLKGYNFQEIEVR